MTVTAPRTEGVLPRLEPSTQVGRLERRRLRTRRDRPEGRPRATVDDLPQGGPGEGSKVGRHAPRGRRPTPPQPPWRGRRRCRSRRARPRRATSAVAHRVRQGGEQVPRLLETDTQREAASEWRRLEATPALPSWSCQGHTLRQRSIQRRAGMRSTPATTYGHMVGDDADTQRPRRPRRRATRSRPAPRPSRARRWPCRGRSR